MTSLSREKPVLNRKACSAPEVVTTGGGQRGCLALSRLSLPYTLPPGVCAGLWPRAPGLVDLSRFPLSTEDGEPPRRFDRSNSRAGNISTVRSEQADPAGAGTQVWVGCPLQPHPRAYKPACPAPSQQPGTQ